MWLQCLQCSGFLGVQIRLLDPALFQPNQKFKATCDDGVARSFLFSSLEGKPLDFCTPARPAKRALAWLAEVALRSAKQKNWPAAEDLDVPEAGWSSDTCDASLRERFFADALDLMAGGVGSSEVSE